MIEEGEFLVIAPKSKSLQSVQILMAVICGIGSILLLLFFSTRQPSTVITSRGFGYAAVMFIAGGLGFAYISLWRANVRLLIGQGQVGHQGIFGRRQVWLRGQLDRAVDMTVIYTRSARPVRGVYLLAADGKRVLALNARAWNPEDVRDFIQASGAVLDYRDQPLTAAEAKRQFPKAFGWGTQHVMLGTIVTMILTIVLVVGGYVLWTTLSHS